MGATRVEPIFFGCDRSSDVGFMVMRGTMSRMLSFDVVIQKFGESASESYMKYDFERDQKALEALRSGNVVGICSWLNSYSVLQGFTSAERMSISEAVLGWANVCDTKSDLSSALQLDKAHEEMAEACTKGLGRKRDFTSLASKALWLCYPAQVPIFDSIASRALCVLSHLEEGIEAVPVGLSKYGRFAHRWKHFYDTYSDSIRRIDVKPGQYPVRVFDAILLCVGEIS